jgi:membrane glycosyltransferase
MLGIPIMSSTSYLPYKRLRRWLFLGLIFVTASIGVTMMIDIVRNNGITALEILILTLFTAAFSWIAISFWNAVIGFLLMLIRRDPLSLGPALVLGRESRLGGSRTALVMPVRNEDPSRVTAGLCTVMRSLSKTGQAEQFDLFLLSDTTEPAVARTEEIAWKSFRKQMGHTSGLHYRRRTNNVGRKAGNIADFCKHWGSNYDFMIVLDADSIMTGTALVHLVRAMESDPRAGLIQTVPIPAQSMTLFARLVQFAGCLYSPILASGQSFWQTDAANYWGHNAIIRIGPFVQYCCLPVLPGRPPLGGAILSHDFVEAALMRRAGWGVFLLPWLDGSYEEAPGNIVDYAKRDRRWTQGSLQHLRLLMTPGLHTLNRVHFLLGAIGYLSSVVWLLMLLASTAYVLVPALSTKAVLAIPWQGKGSVIPLLVVTVGLLLVPKFLALILVLTGDRDQYGGVVRLLASVALETLFAVVAAPLMMMYHTRFVLSVLSGYDVKWNTQVRESRDIAWSEAWSSVVLISIVGAGWAGATLYFSPKFFLWMTPIFVGLLLAAPLIRWTSSQSLGEWTQRLGLFLVPSETVPPLELQVFPPLLASMSVEEGELAVASGQEAKLTT